MDKLDLKKPNLQQIVEVKTGHFQLNEQKSKFDLKTKTFDYFFYLKAENFEI